MAEAGDGRAHKAQAASGRALWTAFGLITGYMAIEVVGGLLADSLALLADAAHMVTDAAAIGLALVALWVAGRPASGRHTYGLQRAEVIAALLNAVSLWLIAGWIFFEASRRFSDPREVQGTVMLSVGAVGLLVNVSAAVVLRRAAGESLNVQGALLHVVGDLLGSVAVVAGAIMVLTLDWPMADPAFSVVIGAIILYTSARLLNKVLRVLMQGTPPHLDVPTVCRRLEQVEGVTGVHDVHVWSLTSGYDVLSAHVTAAPGAPDESARILHRLRETARKEFGIAHVTIQLESAAEDCRETHHLPHS